jgi:hypothetical protein
MTTTVQFLKDHVAAGGRQFRKGEVAALTDDLAQDLIREGIAKQRIPPSPAIERKGET